MWDDNGSYSAGKKGKKKGKKRKNYQRGDDRGYGSGGYGGGGGAYQEGPPREHIQLVSDDMLQYVKELANQLQGDEIDEEGKEILVTNALEEFIGKETQICKDPACSRAVESLVNLFTTEQLTNFMGSLSQGDEERITGIFIDPFASHVVERLFDRIKSVLSEGEVASELLGALEELCQCLHHERLLNIATHKYGSHVMRSLFVLVSGVEYPTTRTNKGWNKIFSFSIEKAQTFAKYRTNKKLVHLKDKLARNYLALPTQDVVGMAYDQYGGPVLQTFLQCTMGEDVSSQMIFKVLESKKHVAEKEEEGSHAAPQPAMNLCPKAFQDFAKHNIASHLMESVFISADESIRSALYEQCVKGHLKTFVLHPYANFVIQALLTCATNKNVAKAVVEELLPLFEEMLNSNKGGVVAATLNMSSRLNVKTSKAFKAIESLLRTKLEREGVELKERSSTLILGLLAIDMRGRPHGSGQLVSSKVGGTILCTLLKFPPEKCKNLMRSMEYLTTDEILQLTEDYLGIRVLEAYLDSTVDQKHKQPLIRNVKGHFGFLAQVTHCSFFLEKCFKNADTDLKEVIVEDLIEKKNAILQTYRGPGIFKTCAVELYQRSKREWTQHLAKMESMQKSYQEMFA